MNHRRISLYRLGLTCRRRRADVELAVKGPQHLPSTDDVLVYDERLHQPSSGDLSTRAPSSFVDGSRAAWHSQETDDDYPVPGQRTPLRQPTPVQVQECRARRKLTAAEEADVLEQHLIELRRLAEAACQRPLAEITT